MVRHDESQSLITEHARALVMDQKGLAATIYIGDTSFVVELPRKGSVTLGRSSDADVQLRATSVSRIHARLDITGDGTDARVIDAGSRNGTLVNGVPLTAERPVGHGDELGLGDVRVLLLRRATISPDIIAIQPRSFFVEHVAAAIARCTERDEPLYLFALQLPGRWDATVAARRAFEGLPRVGTYGLLEDNVVGICAPATQADEAASISTMFVDALAKAGIRTVCGIAAHARGQSAEDLVDAAAVARSEQSGQTERPRAPVAEDFLAIAPVMRGLVDQAKQFAQSPLPVLLIGETGAGKEVFARLIHRASGRSGKLIAVNAAALPEALLESELFGHERGAFSGANQPKVGLIEAAHGGTLFLDEIGELPLAMQAKLLRVLEDMTIRRVGGSTERKVDVRIVSATNRNLEEFVRERRFRQDLLFRLNACTIHIPPLRERRQEIPALATFFIERAARGRSIGAPTLSTHATALLERYEWPGNLRELRNVMDRALALCTTGTIQPNHLPDAIARDPGRPSMMPRIADDLGPPSSMSGIPMSPDSTRAPVSAALAAPSGGVVAAVPAGQGGPIRDSMRDFERDKIQAALDQADGNTTRAAAILGIPRRTLAYRMKRLGITS